MADKSAPEASAVDDAQSTQKTIRRRIPGNLPYTGSAGVLRRTLDRLPISEKPSVFTADFLSTVLGATGGAARPIIPILKSTGFLNQSGTPTELYTQFQTDGGRSAAAIQALKNGFQEVFKRNQYAHRLDDKDLVDVVVAITGLPKSDKVVRAIVNTFEVFQQFVKIGRDDTQKVEKLDNPLEDEDSTEGSVAHSDTRKNIGLVYNINIVLPETTNIDVYNSIFKSIKGNLL